ncbi:hypothetical protein F511_20804 [Dorcoceras hygrometricum]|uniref:Uncharacterized protein n=1 Tax=Dorcoceras hygrometricum TaxID=472368 RepID=A0A2Z7B6R2_9LAMI|nr:hypothetical protein F511_20804 [Dorcoceras hygrometricum]
MVCDQQLNGLSSSADRFIKSNQQMLLSRSAGKFFQAFFQSKLLDNDDEDSAGYQSYFRRKLKVFQIRSFAHKKKICTIVQLPGMKETTDDRYRKEERYKRDEEDNERTVDRSKDKSKDKFKERSSDRKMKTSSNKRFSRKHDRKVLVAEESTKSWADSDSDSSSSSSSSSDSEQEEVHCLMADQTDDDEVFDFSNVEFTRDDLVIALNVWSKSTGSFLIRSRKLKPKT